jgi:CheY-like chemotaxis protein
LLLVDNRHERRSVIRTLLQARAGEATLVAEAAATAAFAAVRAGPVDAAVLGSQMPVPVEIAVIAALRAEQPAPVIVVCSFHADPATQYEALAGADTYLTKPVSPRDLLIDDTRSGRTATLRPHFRTAPPIANQSSKVPRRDRIWSHRRQRKTVPPASPRSMVRPAYATARPPISDTRDPSFGRRCLAVLPR